MKSAKKGAKGATDMKPASRISPELSAVIKALAGSRAKGPTLSKLRAALKGAGMTWSREGELLFPQDRTALLIEIDELIDTYGVRADASALVPRRNS